VYLLEFLAALGAAQGALLLLLIILRYRHRKSVPLALLLLAFSLRLGTIPSWNPSTLTALPWLFPATTPLPFLFGPLLWWSARELSRDTEATPQLLPLHFLPYAAETVVISVTILSMTAVEYSAFVEGVFAGRPPLWLPVRNALKVALNIVYVALAARIALASSTWRLDSGRRLWVRALVVAAIGSLVPFAFVAVRPGASARLAAGGDGPFLILAAAMALLIYTCTMLVLATPGVPGCTKKLPAPPTSPSPRNASAEEGCTRLAARLRRELTSGIFRDPELSLRELAEHLNVHPNRLSSAINHVYGESFPRLLTRCRIDYFIRRVLGGALEHQTILDLAFEAGFPSKSTFNRVFRENLGVAPSTFATAVVVSRGLLSRSTPSLGRGGPASAELGKDEPEPSPQGCSGRSRLKHFLEVTH
jgi:AraC-like DNA-binding protein